MLLQRSCKIRPHSPKEAIVCFKHNILVFWHVVGYSFGVVLYELFHRAHPYGTQDPWAVALDVIERGTRPQISPDCPIDVQCMFRIDAFIILCLPYMHRLDPTVLGTRPIWPSDNETSPSWTPSAIPSSYWRQRGRASSSSLSIEYCSFISCSYSMPT